MRFYILLLCILHPVASTFIWKASTKKKPIIYEIEKNLFQQKVIDSYTSDLPIQSTIPTQHTPQLDTNSNNPYRSNNITRFALYNANFGVPPIPIYDLNSLQVKVINDIFVECYDYNDCLYDLSENDRAELSLYASFIENSGLNSVNVPYSIGLIRSKYSTNVLGMYTEGFSQLNNQIGFWIRLEDGDGNRLYSSLKPEEKTVTILDLAVHERSHFDQPTYNSNEAHCDNFQSNYNYLFQKAGRNFHQFVLLTDGTNEETETVGTIEILFIILFSATFIVAAIFMYLYFWKESKKKIVYGINQKSSETVPLYLNY